MRRIVFNFAVGLAAFAVGALLTNAWLGLFVSLQDSPVALVDAEHTGIADNFDALHDQQSIYTAILERETLIDKHFVLVGARPAYPSVGSLDSDMKLAVVTPSLRDMFSDWSNIRVIDEHEEDRIVQTADSWSYFHLKYPKAVGLVRFSGISFNDDHTKAQVTFAFGCGGLCGHGNLMTLRKINGRWIVTDFGIGWVS
jgi:hypothetical protein